MSGILDGLMQELGGGGLEAIAGKLGVNSGQAQTALQSALPMLLGALANNSANPEGAQALHAALQQHATAAPVQQQVQQATQNPGANTEGAAILGHILGQKQDAATQGISHISGLDAGSAGALMGMLAPVVMGYLGRHAQQANLDPGQLASSLGQQASAIQNSGGAAGSLIDAVLGHSGSGKLDLSGLLSAGANILGSLTKR